MSNHDPLRDTLRNRADQLGNTHPLTLDDVKGRAKGIRRRRAAVSGLAAAAVLAVAAPVGLAVTDGLGTDPDSPPVAGPSVTPSEGGSSDPAPQGPQRVTLTTDVEETSEAPGIAYLYDGSIIQGEYSLVLGADYDSFAPVGDGWVATRNEEGNFFVDLLDPDGEVLVSAPSTSSLAVSTDGTVAVYATPDGELVAVTEGGQRRSLVNPEGLPAGILSPVAVIGSESCDPESAGGGCAVFFSSDDVEEQGAWSATSKGIVSPFPQLLDLGGLAPDGSVSGTVSVSDDGSCSVVLGPDRERVEWKTCDYTLGQFSPDGRFVIGHPAYRSGIGDGSVAILDAATGDLLAEFQNSEEHPAFINNVVWDTDNTLLTTVFEAGSWSLMRMAADGELSMVRADLGDNMDEVPLHLATQP